MLQTSDDQHMDDQMPPPPTPSADGNLTDLTAALAPILADLPRVPQQARSREKRDILLKAAARIFVARGYALTIADDIAAAAGVSVGTFYNYFRNKRQILLVLVLDRLDSIFTHLGLAQLDLVSENRREAIHTAIAAVMSNNEQTGLRRVWMELVSVDPDLVPYQHLIRRYALGKLEAHIQQVVATGQTWPNLDAPATAVAIFTLLDSLSLQGYEDIADERIIASVTDMIYRAIFPPAIGKTD